MTQSPFTSAWRLFFFGLIVVCLGACSPIKVSKQSAAVESLSTLRGEVKVATDEAGSVQVRLFRPNDMGFAAIGQQPLYGDGSYLFYVEAGSYAVGTFLDVNGDGEYVSDEPATYHGEEQGEPQLIQVDKGETHTVPQLTIERVLVRHLDVPQFDEFPLSLSNIGRIVDLGDERFSVSYSSMGQWRPVDFLETVGAGLFLLQAFDADKVPVIFVHGINGSPANFTEIIAALDPGQFQPWVLHYPSGLPLDIVSEYMLRALDQLRLEHHFERIFVVAHSMGGLMTRSFVLRHQEARSDVELGLVVTINSPLYGMDSAAFGVKSSPVVVSAWRDVASNSEYVKRVHASPWPSNVPYHLVFSYLDGKAGDGVVPMRSQLSRSLQAEARQIHGFNVEHSEILRDQDFIEQLNRILSSP